MTDILITPDGKFTFTLDAPVSAGDTVLTGTIASANVNSNPQRMLVAKSNYGIKLNETLSGETPVGELSIDVNNIPDSASVDTLIGFNSSDALVKVSTTVAQAGADGPRILMDFPFPGTLVAGTTGSYVKIVHRVPGKICTITGIAVASAEASRSPSGLSRFTVSDKPPGEAGATTASVDLAFDKTNAAITSCTIPLTDDDGYLWPALSASHTSPLVVVIMEQV